MTDVAKATAPSAPVGSNLEGARAAEGQRRPARAAARPFAYQAVGPNGEIERGRIRAGDRTEVVDRLRRLGKQPLTVAPASRSIFDTEFSVPGFGPRIKGAELAVVARQFATMVGAGIPLVRCLAVLEEQVENPLLRATLADMEASVSSGDSLSQAMHRHPEVFDELFVSMVRAGEAAGALDVVLGQIATSKERSVAITNKVRSALTYPAAVLAMVVVVVIAMLLFVVPVFSGIYADVDGTLPLPTRMIVGLSAVMTDYVLVVAAAGVAAAVGLRRWRSTEHGRRRLDAAKLRAPLVGPLIHKAALARMGRTLAVLSRAGVPVLDALRIAADTTGNQVLTDALRDAANGVRAGGRIAKNLEQHPVFPPMVLQLVSVGEETGAMDEMLDVVGETYEGEVETAVAGFASIIEPLLMAVIGSVVGGMVIALYLPMFRLIDVVQ